MLLYSGLLNWLSWIWRIHNFWVSLRKGGQLLIWHQAEGAKCYILVLWVQGPFFMRDYRYCTHIHTVLCTHLCMHRPSISTSTYWQYFPNDEGSNANVNSVWYRSLDENMDDVKSEYWKYSLRTVSYHLESTASIHESLAPPETPLVRLSSLLYPSPGLLGHVTIVAGSRSAGTMINSVIFDCVLFWIRVSKVELAPRVTSKKGMSDKKILNIHVIVSLEYAYPYFIMVPQLHLWADVKTVVA